MAAGIINGKQIAAQIQSELKGQVERMAARGAGLDWLWSYGITIRPRVCSLKEKSPTPNPPLLRRAPSCWDHHSKGELLALLDRLNADPKIHGISSTASSP